MWQLWGINSLTHHPLWDRRDSRILLRVGPLGSGVRFEGVDCKEQYNGSARA